MERTRRGRTGQRNGGILLLSGKDVKLFDATKIPVLGRALDAYALRHKVIATNLANITTPGYQSRKVAFEEQLSGALGATALPGVTTHQHHMPIGRDPVVTVQPTVQQPDASANLQNDPMASGLNNVDLDNEMAELAKNQIRFKFSSRLLSETFRGLQKSIRGTQ